MKNMVDLNKSTAKIIDGSNLLRGLLVLIIKDKKIAQHEERIFLEEGKKLGFEKEFCLEAIHNGLRNKNIVSEIPVFLNKQFAFEFLNLGMKILHEDSVIDKNKLEFLEKTACRNGIAKEIKISFDESSFLNKENINRLRIGDNNNE